MGRRKRQTEQNSKDIHEKIRVNDAIGRTQSGEIIEFPRPSIVNSSDQRAISSRAVFYLRSPTLYYEEVRSCTTRRSDLVLQRGAICTTRRSDLILRECRIVCYENARSFTTRMSNPVLRAGSILHYEEFRICTTRRSDCVLQGGRILSYEEVRSCTTRRSDLVVREGPPV